MSDWRPPTLAGELIDIKRRLAALARSPRKGARAEPFSPAWTGVEGMVPFNPQAARTGPDPMWVRHIATDLTGLNKPVLVVDLPMYFHPSLTETGFTAAVRLRFGDQLTNPARMTARDFSSPWSNTNPRVLRFAWVHGAPVGWDASDSLRHMDIEVDVYTADTGRLPGNAWLALPTQVIGLSSYTWRDDNSNTRSADTTGAAHWLDQERS
ncbi:hypothetical protein GCM10012275_08120 [Longimycelium tulufanense]|uniref:Uncharacterized protein n=1 Tax=Longimycelium tulufanense TaxID=907463 RepID=A0A8J3C6D1_9PSEU|nr:hypothetical protein [Longimycelium tulufanense]GGM39635.1 hypothetical protein GCM10012275_08120 [Longimycelium tulufanense]